VKGFVIVLTAIGDFKWIILRNYDKLRTVQRIVHCTVKSKLGDFEMKLSNGQVVAGIHHLELRQLDDIFRNVQVKELAHPTLSQHQDVLKEIGHINWVCGLTEYIAEVGNGTNWAIRLGEATSAYFEEMNFQNIHFLGGYLKNKYVPEHYVDALEHVFFVLEFDV